MVDSYPCEIARSGERELTIIWDDEHRSVYPTPYLRECCGCAACVDEWTGRTLIEPGSIPPTVDVVDAEHVGSYAVRFVFTDRHADGIYSFRRLRQFCPCDACALERRR